MDRGKRITYLSVSTIINGLISIFNDLGIDFALAAPTGRAAQRIYETTGVEASTIHRLLEFEYSENLNSMTFKRDEDYPLEVGAVIVDESSMIDIQLLSSLLKAIPFGTRLVFVGDADQLPSVGPGNVLSDLINSDIAQTVKLDQIHRQDKNSMIATNAHLINNGEIPKVDNSSDFMLVNKNDSQVTLDTIIDLVYSRFPKAFNYDPLNDIQVISPLKKGLLGTVSLNAELQKKLNPPSPRKKERNFGSVVFREGDKVMQIKNNYGLEWENPVTGVSGTGIFNGDIGIIKHMNKDGLIIEFLDNRISEYSYDQLEELIHAYAVTVHKSQGSEFKVVIMPLLSGYPQFLNRRLLYTAVTRAKEKLMLVGKSKWFDYMVLNNIENDRRSMLDKLIKEYSQQNSFF